MSSRTRSLAAVLVGLSLPGCFGEPLPEGTGSAVAEVQTVPAGVGCLRVVYRLPTATADTTRNFGVTPGASASFDLGYLAAGVYSFRASAYSVACGSVAAATVPAWVGDPAAVTIAPGVVSTVSITLRPNVTTRTNVDFVQPVRAIYAGSPSYSTYAVMQDGTVRAWGQNHRGELGDGTTANAATPRVVAGLVNPTQIAGDSSYACATTESSGLYCWGDNTYGQFADGTTAPSLTPRRNGDVAPDAIAVSSRRLCGRFGHAVSCWGGDLTPGTPIATPADGIAFGSHDGLLWLMTRADVVVATSPDGAGTALGRLRSTDVASSVYANCFLTTGHTVVCRGVDDFGEVGDGPGVPDPSEERNTGLTDVTDIASGFRHLCALRSNGTVWCWGFNNAGQVGAGLDADRAEAPMPVPLSNVVQIAVGSMHACALLADGSVWCWGDNTNGQLGDGTDTNRYSPVRVRF